MASRLEGQFTVTLTLLLRWKEPEVAVTSTLYVPAGVRCKPLGGLAVIELPQATKNDSATSSTTKQSISASLLLHRPEISSNPGMQKESASQGADERCMASCEPVVWTIKFEVTGPEIGVTDEGENEQDA